MTINNTSPNVDEYYIGKGIVTMKPLGGVTWFDVGNVPEFEFTPNVDELEHNSSRAGTKTRDRTVVLTKGGDLRVVLEEWTAFNMAIILLGDITPIVGPPTGSTVEILGNTSYSTGVRFQGQNDVGPRWNYEFLRVDFVPSGSLNPISEEWGGLEVTGRLAAVDIGGGVLSFGTAKRLTAGGTLAFT